VTTLSAPRRNPIRNDVRSIPTRMHTHGSGERNPPTKRKQTIQRVDDDDDDRTAETLGREARSGDSVEPRQEREHADKDGIVDLRGTPAGGLVGDEGARHGKDDDVKDKLDRADDPSNNASGMHGERVCVRARLVMRCVDGLRVLQALGGWIAAEMALFCGQLGWM
jgi:hypothetical protein